MKILKKIDIPLNQKEELLDLNKQESKSVKFITIKITQDYINIITNYQRVQQYKNDKYNKKDKYNYLVFNLRTNSREYI